MTSIDNHVASDTGASGPVSMLRICGAGGIRRDNARTRRVTMDTEGETQEGLPLQAYTISGLALQEARQKSDGVGVAWRPGRSPGHPHSSLGQEGQPRGYPGRVPRGPCKGRFRHRVARGRLQAPRIAAVAVKGGTQEEFPLRDPARRQQTRERPSSLDRGEAYRRESMLTQPSVRSTPPLQEQGGRSTRPREDSVGDSATESSPPATRPQTRARPERLARGEAYRGESMLSLCPLISTTPLQKQHPSTRPEEGLARDLASRNNCAAKRARPRVRAPDRWARDATNITERLGEVHVLTELRDWRWVPNIVNPSDIDSRNATVPDLSPTGRWLCSPDFIRKPSENMPKERGRAAATPDDAPGKRAKCVWLTPHREEAPPETEALHCMTTPHPRHHLDLRFVRRCRRNNRAAGGRATLEKDSAGELLCARHRCSGGGTTSGIVTPYSGPDHRQDGANPGRTPRRNHRLIAALQLVAPRTGRPGARRAHGQVRVARVKTAAGESTRPATRLAMWQPGEAPDVPPGQPSEKTQVVLETQSDIK